MPGGTSRRRNGWLGVLTSWRTFAVLAIVAVGIGFLGVRAVQRQVEQRAMQSLEVPGDGAVVRSVIHLACDLGRVSLAEGVESEEVWARLIELGCDPVPGCLLSPPLPPDRLIDRVASWGSARLATTVRLT